MAIISVIKYDGSPDVFAWKYPNNELGTWTKLIVNESQEAILVKGGQVCDVFSAGRHTLDTANIPILNKLINLPFGGRSPFTAEVWYINKVFSLDVKWGTSTPIQLQDPKYKVFVPVRAFGQFGIQIEEAKKFLLKLVGTLPLFDKGSILKFFRGVYLTKAKDVISSYLVHKNISVLEINAYILLNALVLCVLLVVDVIIIYFGGYVGTRNKSLAESQAVIDALYTKAKGLMIEWQESVYKKDLDEISEMLMYSDNSALSTDEVVISDKLEELQKLLAENNEEISQKICEIKNAIKLRSLKIKSNKRGSY